VFKSRLKTHLFNAAYS